MCASIACEDFSRYRCTDCSPRGLDVGEIFFHIDARRAQQRFGALAKRAGAIGNRGGITRGNGDASRRSRARRFTALSVLRVRSATRSSRFGSSMRSKAARRSCASGSLVARSASNPGRVIRSSAAARRSRCVEVVATFSSSAAAKVTSSAIRRVSDGSLALAHSMARYTPRALARTMPSGSPVERSRHRS